MVKFLTGSTALSGATPQNVAATAVVGTALTASRGDHVHAIAAGGLTLAQLAQGTSAQVLMESAAPTATWTTVSGDVTISATGVTAIGTAKVTAAMQAAAPLAHVWQRIATTTIGSDTATVTFSSIATGFIRLKLLIQGQGNDATNRVLKLQFNQDGTTNCTSKAFEFSGAGTFNENDDVQGFWQMGFIANNTVGQPSFIEITIDNIAAKMKQVIGTLWAQDLPRFLINAGVWQDSTNEISRLDLTLNVGSWLSGSKFTLYGMVG